LACLQRSRFRDYRGDALAGRRLSSFIPALKEKKRVRGMFSSSGFHRPFHHPHLRFFFVALVFAVGIWTAVKVGKRQGIPSQQVDGHGFL